MSGAESDGLLTPEEEEEQPPRLHGENSPSFNPLASPR
jgi:hypothetical protein